MEEFDYFCAAKWILFVFVSIIFSRFAPSKGRIIWKKDQVILKRYR